MKGSRFSEEQIIGILREQEAGTTHKDDRAQLSALMPSARPCCSPHNRRDGSSS